MNRLKLWLFALVVVAAAGVAVYLHTRTMREEALAAVDADVASAAQHAEAAKSALAHDAAAAAALVARDPALAGTLASGGASATDPAARAHRTRAVAPAGSDPAAAELVTERAARAALAGAERALGFRLPEGTTVIAASRETLERREAGAGEAAALLRAAVEGGSPRGHVRAGGKLLFAAAAPAGDGAGVLVLAPVGEAFARGIAAASRVPVLLVAPEAKPIAVGILPLADEAAIVKAASIFGVTSDAGRLGPVDLGVSAVKLPRAPLLGASAPGYRVRSVALEGVKGAAVIAVAPTASSLAPIVILQWQAIGALGLAIVLAGLFGVLVRAAEPAPMLPESLLSAAARLEKGDFSARVPELAGQLGTVAAALNRAAEAASTPPAAAPAPAEDLFARAARPAEADPSAFEFPLRAPEPLAPAAEASAAPPAPPAPAPGHADAARAGVIVPPAPAEEPLAAPAELLQAAAQAAAPDGDDEQGHWRQVFSDFLRTRGECGEAAGGLTFERFAQKLASNKAALVSKYACRTVRFQVYVKDGKAALKATPVR
ncbi:MULTISPECIES: MXAN_5187 family protein [Anaeromyxobacter]|uniref:MXAN_5187 family protein n=1 Tax=Anaeromyxobacter TaxID=161492 RepID=UPI002413674D|nr:MULTISPECIES: MXAN_5187 family protein [unclassified Anaeromyxobacter]